MDPSELLRVSVEDLRTKTLEELLELMVVLGLATEGIGTTTQALTRLASAAYSAEV